MIATVPSGKKAGRYIGRIAVRKTGRFNIQTAAGVIEGIRAFFRAIAGTGNAPEGLNEIP